MIQLGRLFASFRHALRGAVVVFREEQSFRIQVVVALITLGFAWVFLVTPAEWMILVLLIGCVLVLELINSVFERLVDAFKPRIHPAVRDIKDIMAAVVLIASLVAAVVGTWIFLPYILVWTTRFAA